MGSAFSQQQYVVAKPPTGRLTLTSGTPVMAAEAASQTTIYYTPYTGSMVPVYDGTGWRERSFSELSLALAGSANWASGSNYDLFIYDDSGTLRLLTGPAWTNDTTRSTAISRLNGLWVNDASMTGRYGASSTLTVGQYRGLYVGTVRMSANGTTTWGLGGTASSGGTEVKQFLWNAHNRVETVASTADNTASWTYATDAWRAKNGSSTNRVSFVQGLNEEPYFAHEQAYILSAANNAGEIGIGLDSTTATGLEGGVETTGGNYRVPGQVHDSRFAGIGYHYLAPLERSSNGGTITFYGPIDAVFTSADVQSAFWVHRKY